MVLRNDWSEKKYFSDSEAIRRVELGGNLLGLLLVAGESLSAHQTTGWLLLLRVRTAGSPTWPRPLLRRNGSAHDLRHSSGPSEDSGHYHHTLCIGHWTLQCCSLVGFSSGGSEYAHRHPFRVGALRRPGRLQVAIRRLVLWRHPSQPHGIRRNSRVTSKPTSSHSIPTFIT